MRIKGIASDALNYILEASKFTHPEEFGGVLQEKDGIITDVLLLPGTRPGKRSVSIKYFMMPNIRSVGIVHSHPSSNRNPSQADLHIFATRGNCHIIVGYPYDIQSWTCYDREGNIRELQVIDEKFEDFEEAILDGANFERANLEGTNLENVNFKGANLQWAFLKRVNLEGANLQEANLKEAYFKEAYLEKTNFKGADLEKADLRGAYNLSFDQLSEVKTLYDAKLDRDLLIELKKKYPILFEKLAFMSRDLPQ
jgi:proteasome lid subunit RPN8/RPN11